MTNLEETVLIIGSLDSISCGLGRQDARLLCTIVPGARISSLFWESGQLIYFRTHLFSCPLRNPKHPL